uniref:odorant receptor 90 n=1 Tax=Aedes aegypti TaxID=7159 RepID=UPI000C2CD52E|nr:odorant receptor 90 [Aedes aegypti]
MDRWRWTGINWLVKLQQASSNNHFHLAEVIMVVGGSFYSGLTTYWPRSLYYFSQILATYHVTIIISCLVESLYPTMDSGSALWFTLLLIFLFSGFIREYFVRKNILHITEVKHFLNHSQITSQDNEYDASVRRNLYRNIRITCVGHLALVIISQFSAPILMLQQNKYYRIPHVFQSMGPTFAIVMQFCYIMTVFPLWINKVFGPTILVTAIMLGLEKEYGIVARGLGNFVDHKKSDVRGNNKMFWRLLDQQLRFQIDQHLLLTKNLMKLQLVISNLYFAIHYCAVLLIGVSIYLFLLEDSLAGRLIIVLAIVSFSFECYWWCNIAESFQIMNTALEEHILDLMVMVPYHVDHHSDYIQLRTTLMIFKINIRNSARFSCGGIFQLSKESFVQIVQRSYTLFAFLVNIGFSNSNF